ncbi:hypothetical protein THAOC_02482 [Thalassiosira oceanica]|uniref:Uncharacterized protein n=1 Tax=Thalassiosira oceanica TaxID=159749 RepID=K0TQC1_THAOC|nr:hypothetical protein THAOC_02482 [Thalassiosira oceanica]|eukprot:EJK75787.1 hypothetical protein THAOC_02482 [Thalassiosira oceanica]
MRKYIKKPRESAPRPKRGGKQQARAPDFFLVRIQAPDGNQSLLSIWVPLSIMAASSARANHQLEMAAQAAQSAVVAHGNKLRGAPSLGRPDVASEVRNAASLASRALVEAGGSRQAGAAVRQAVEAGGRLLMPSLESNQTIHLDHHQPEQRDDAAMDKRNASSGLNARASADDKFPIDEVHVTAGGLARRRTSGLIASVESSDQSGDIANSNGNSNMSNSKSKSKTSRRSSEGILSCSNRGDGASGMSSRSQACPPNRSRSPWFTSELNSGLAPAQVVTAPPSTKAWSRSFSKPI